MIPTALTPGSIASWFDLLRGREGTSPRTVVEIKLTTIGEPTTADSQATTAIHDQLDRAFARLSTEHRTVIVLVHYLGMSLAEAADVIGVPLGTVQSRLSRATQAMRGALEADERLMTPETGVA